MDTSHLEKAHPSEKVYVKVAIFLAVITGIEIVISYVEMAVWIAVVALVVLSIIKFGAVVAYFMHLKFDNPALRKPFIGGIVLALTVYTIVLLAFALHENTPVS
jgi:cytochrome c oxidase subunit 4